METFTKEEAEKQMALGKKITHRSFLPSEYVYEKNNRVFTEKKNSISKIIFWVNKNHSSFKDGWSLFEEEIEIEKYNLEYVEYIELLEKFNKEIELTKIVIQNIFNLILEQQSFNKESYQNLDISYYDIVEEFIEDFELTNKLHPKMDYFVSHYFRIIKSNNITFVKFS